VLSNYNNTFTLNISRDTTYLTSINATLHYNNTAYFAGSTNNFTVYALAPVVTDSSLIPLYWTLNLNGDYYNTSTYYQNVSNFFLDNCSNYTTVALNFTLYDEGNGSNVNADLTGSFTYISNGLSKTYSLSQTDVPQVKMCISPSYATFTGSYYVYYQSAIYPQRRYYDYNAAYSNITLDVPLYVLSVDDGIYGRFEVTDNNFNLLENVTITMEGLVGASTVILENNQLMVVVMQHSG